jgi:hypothetical protein
MDCLGQKAISRYCPFNTYEIQFMVVCFEIIY